MILNDLYLLVSVLIPGITIVGTFLVLKSTIGQQLHIIQKSAIEAQAAQIKSLQDQNADQAKEIASLKQTLDTVVAALNKSGWKISIDRDLISIQDDSGGSSHARIKGA